MEHRAVRRGERRLLGLSLAFVLILSGCFGNGDGTDEPGSGQSESGDAAYLPVPDGVELTAQGSELAVGDPATVAYEPRQDDVGALKVTVTRLEKASFKQQFVGWKLTPETRKTTPYFVHATVGNVGDTDLGGRQVPLYVVDGENKLNGAWRFPSTFKPCPKRAFPKKFRNGDRTKICLVYLLPDAGDLTAVSFRPTEEFDPIVWTGKVTRPESSQPKKDQPKKNKKGDEKQGKGTSR